MQHLPLGTKLHKGSYTTGKVLGQGGFGVIYAGSDTRLQRLIAVKEFFPQGCVRQGSVVQPGGAMPAESYERVKAKFMAEATTNGTLRKAYDNNGLKDNPIRTQTK